MAKDKPVRTCVGSENQKREEIEKLVGLIGDTTEVRKLVEKVARLQKRQDMDEGCVREAALFGLYEAARDFDPQHKKGAKFTTFAATYMKTQIHDDARKSKRDYARYSLLDASTESISDCADDFPASDTVVQWREFIGIVKGRLSPEIWKIVSMYFLDGYTTREIADELGMNHATVRTQLIRVRNKVFPKLRQDPQILDYWNNYAA